MKSDDAGAGKQPAGASVVGTERSGKLDFDHIYRLHFFTVSRWVTALGAPTRYREDLIQDVFVIVHRRLPEFDGEHLVGWLYQITRRRVRDFRRLHWFRSLFAGSEVDDTAASPSASPEAALSEHQEARDKAALLSRLLDRLPEAQRTVFVLFEIEGYSGEQIAEFQSLPINTVWTRLRKARLALLKHGKRLQKTAEGRV